MSKTRSHQPMLADHKLFVLYRWLSWLIAGVAIVWQGSEPQYVVLLMVVAAMNLVATVCAQAYVRSMQRHPTLLSLDVVFSVIVLFFSHGWSGPMALYALSALVLPALLFGWLGGLMAGLLMDSLFLAVSISNSMTPDRMLRDGYQIELLAMLVAAPLFGCFFPMVIDMFRRGLEQREANRRRKTRSPFDEPRVDRSTNLESGSRLAPRPREQERRPASFAELQPTRGTTVRAVEPSTEELRRVLFAPFPQHETDLSSAINLLATRYSGHTGAAARVTLLGRARTLAFAQQTVLVRLLQEALLNVQQHAHAGKVELTLRYDALSVALLVQDDGVGLLDGTYERPGLHALRAMQYRLAELGGRLDVFETEGGGVTVRATAPLE